MTFVVLPMGTWVICRMGQIDGIPIKQMSVASLSVLVTSLATPLHVMVVLCIFSVLPVVPDSVIHITFLVLSGLFAFLFELCLFWSTFGMEALERRYRIFLAALAALAVLCFQAWVAAVLMKIIEDLE